MKSGAAVFSGKTLLQGIYDQFKNVRDRREPLKIEIPMADALMSAFAIFSLKYSSLLKFEEAMRTSNDHSNLTSIYHVGRVPSDTQMRSILDDVETQDLRPIFKSLFEKAQRAKVLEKYKFMGNHYLLALDGTQCFCSDDVFCESCMKKVVEKDGEKVTSYYHQMLCGSLVKPGLNKVIPFYPEAIRKKPGEEINDSEINAAHRFLKNFREDHPRLKVIVIADAIHANGPLIRYLKLLEMGFILNVKPGSHEKLFEAIARWSVLKQVKHFTQEEEVGDKVKKKVIHEFQYTNKVLFNHSDLNLAVNFVEYWETTQWVSPKGKLKEQKRHFSWVTSMELNESNLMEVMRGGRARWKIENETFNTLKNQGYEFEHNFGHGYKNLSVNFSSLMMLTFLFDQLQELGCKLYQKALRYNSNRRSYLFEKIKSAYKTLSEMKFIFKDWVQFMEFVAGSLKYKMTVTLDTS
jgi:hypothetical protein